ncbi:hypothetical protein ABXJ76_03965 [Methylobacter sp. G7]|uniref:hypothetical protein n=1 Tax=Methylobacter sp. G7 TaxID=3230117 RepID=UPI003D801724
MNNLAKLFKTTPERIRPHLMSKNLIVKNSTDIETAKKYKKALENIGCIVEIESELSFDIPEIVPVQSSNKNKTTIENAIIANESVKDNTLSQSDLKDKTVH